MFTQTKSISHSIPSRSSLLLLLGLILASTSMLTGCGDENNTDGGSKKTTESNSNNTSSENVLSKTTMKTTIYGEDFIEKGIEANDVEDGWKITFKKFDVSLKEIKAIPAADGATPITIEPKKTNMWALTKDSNGKGQVVSESTEVPNGNISLAYTIAKIEVKGEASKGTEKKEFEWKFDDMVRYSKCGTITLKKKDKIQAEDNTYQITVHSDHLIAFKKTSEEEFKLRFDEIAAADTNSDNVISEAELKKAGIPNDWDTFGDTSIQTLWDLIKRNSHTVGHVNGEGHCEETTVTPGT